VHEATGEGQEPDEREKDGQRSDGLGVDEAGFSPGVVAQGLVGVKPFTGEADDDCCKCELFISVSKQKEQNPEAERHMHTSPMRSSMEKIESPSGAIADGCCVARRWWLCCCC